MQTAKLNHSDRILTLSNVFLKIYLKYSDSYI